MTSGQPPLHGTFVIERHLGDVAHLRGGTEIHLNGLGATLPGGQPRVLDLL